MENDVIYTLGQGQRVTSSYAEIYFDDNYCSNVALEKPVPNRITNKQEKYSENKQEWTSPSDLLIGTIQLKPPFTSKITRGKTHKGILSIGNTVLENEYATFLKKLKRLLNDNDSSWNHILIHEKEVVEKKVKAIYSKIFESKSKVMKEEILTFYEASLQELENHLRSEVIGVIVSSHASMVSDLNFEIKKKLKAEREILEKVLQERYDSEVNKIKMYYKLLINNEHYRKKMLLYQALRERNEVLKAFYKQFESENLTSTMYVMCKERKKCKIRHFILDNYQTTDLLETIGKLKDKEDVLRKYKEKYVPISQLNKEWEEKMQKVLQLFLKFISFSLKLLPEQTTFLLDFEKMVILQLNEIQKMPIHSTSILVDEDKFENVITFQENELIQSVCEKEPFVVEGDLSDLIPTRYGSTETLPSKVDLPYIRLQRQFVYAKCHKFEDIKEMLADSPEFKYCTCLLDEDSFEPFLPITKSNIQTQQQDPNTHKFEDIKEMQADSPEYKYCTCLLDEDSLESFLSDDKKNTQTQRQDPNIENFEELESTIKDQSQATISESLPESIIVDNIHRIHYCPNKYCQNWIQRGAFPNLTDFLDFSDEKLKQVKGVLSKLPQIGPTPELISAKDIAYSKMPFSATNEPYHHVETQFSSMEDIYEPEILCPCTSKYELNQGLEIQQESLREILKKHKTSLRILMQQHPRLLKMFTDECFDFKM